ncbi:MAG: aspartate carbamoyltransferase regulatory subunit [Bacteroidales bacterium]|jgi:aspartate carbamoyltransferase regulatory subunit|nr:aspartate carbamoyltransferase regulatory subunit [Bacteroidales bacterium]
MEQKDINTQLKVSAIQDGTVIDHIPSDHLFKVISILKLDATSNQVTFGANLDSKMMGKKAIIKIANKFFEGDDIKKIALFAPHASLNIIRNYQVTRKIRDIGLPDVVEGAIKCFNPACITNHETVRTSFTVSNKGHLALKCKYCEKITTGEQMIIIP